MIKNFPNWINDEGKSFWLECTERRIGKKGETIVEIVSTGIWGTRNKISKSFSLNIIEGFFLSISTISF
jgi:hypothetical protein